MSYNCTNILKWTEAQLKYTYDVTLQEATPQELHEALGEAVMMAISDNWSSSKTSPAARSGRPTIFLPST